MRDVTKLIEELKKITEIIDTENEYGRLGGTPCNMLGLANKAQEITKNLVEALSSK